MFNLETARKLVSSIYRLREEAVQGTMSITHEEGDTVTAEFMYETDISGMLMLDIKLYAAPGDLFTKRYGPAEQVATELKEYFYNY